MFSREIGLGSFLFLGKGMSKHTGEMPSNLLADVYESVVGAMFLDGGLECVKPFILKHLVPEIEQVAATTLGGNAKSLLQQVTQREYGETPRYVLLDEQGPEHNRCFKVAAEVDGQCFPAAWGRNKKEAELKAALNAIAFIHGDPLPHCAD